MLVFVSCRGIQNESKLDAPVGSTEADMSSGNGIFNIKFLKGSFEDGLDLYYHEKKSSIKYTSDKKGIEFYCEKDDLCILTLDANSDEFTYSKYVAYNKMTGFESVIKGEQAEKLYEEILTPWSEPVKRTITLESAVNVIEQEKLIFLKHDKVGSIFCKKRFLEEKPESMFYACWFRYNAIATDSAAKILSYMRGSKESIWKELMEQTNRE